MELLSFQTEFRRTRKPRLVGSKNKTVSHFWPLERAKGSHNKKWYQCTDQIQGIASKTGLSIKISRVELQDPFLKS